jgi:hypothetical protein
MYTAYARARSARYFVGGLYRGLCLPACGHMRRRIGRSGSDLTYATMCAVLIVPGETGLLSKSVYKADSPVGPGFQGGAPSAPT